MRDCRGALFTLLDVCVSSLRRGHANFLCIVPMLTYNPLPAKKYWTHDPRRESKTAAVSWELHRAKVPDGPPRCSGFPKSKKREPSETPRRQGNRWQPVGLAESVARLCFQHLCLPFRPLPYLIWPITCGNSTGLDDPQLCPDCPPPFCPFRSRAQVCVRASRFWKRGLPARALHVGTRGRQRLTNEIGAPHPNYSPR